MRVISACEQRAGPGIKPGGTGQGCYCGPGSPRRVGLTEEGGEKSQRLNMMGRQMLAGAVEEGVGGPAREPKEPPEELVCRERLPVFQ